MLEIVEPPMNADGRRSNQKDFEFNSLSFYLRSSEFIGGSNPPRISLAHLGVLGVLGGSILLLFAFLRSIAPWR